MQRNGIMNYFSTVPAATRHSAQAAAEFKPPRMTGIRAVPAARASGVLSGLCPEG